MGHLIQRAPQNTNKNVYSYQGSIVAKPWVQILYEIHGKTERYCQ